jgi:hypothetical protein
MGDGNDGLDAPSTGRQRGSERHGFGAQRDAPDVRLHVDADEHAPSRMRTAAPMWWRSSS